MDSTPAATGASSASVASVASCEEGPNSSLERNVERNVDAMFERLALIAEAIEDVVSRIQFLQRTVDRLTDDVAHLDRAILFRGVAGPAPFPLPAPLPAPHPPPAPSPRPPAIPPAAALGSIEWGH